MFETNYLKNRVCALGHNSIDFPWCIPKLDVDQNFKNFCNNEKYLLDWDVN